MSAQNGVNKGLDLTPLLLENGSNTVAIDASIRNLNVYVVTAKEIPVKSVWQSFLVVKADN